MKLKAMFLGAVGLVATTAALSTMSFADTPNNARRSQVMMIMDASGSMWGRIGESTKIGVAKRVVGRLMTEWNPELDIGLMAYGHRQTRDCKDIEVLVPPRTGAASVVGQQVQRLNPKGRTPLSASLLKAAAELRATERPGTVLLISDGLETCGRDPCSVAKQLAAQGVDFTAHVVGYDLNAEERESLECIARETGGQYFDANSEEELMAAFRRAAKIVEEKAIRAQHDTARAMLASGQPILTGVPIAWKLYKPEQPDQAVHAGQGDTFTLAVDPGTYIVEAQLGSTRSRVTIHIDEAQIRNHEIALNIAELTAVARKDSGEAVTWNVVDVATRGAFGEKYGDDAVYYLVPSQYHVIATHMGMEQIKPLKVVAGERVKVTVDFRSGNIATQAVNSMTNAAVLADWQVVPLTDSGVGPAVQALSAQSIANFRLGPGHYRVRAIDRKFGKHIEKDVHLTAAANVQSLFSFPYGAASLKANKPVQWKVYALKPNGERGSVIASHYGDAFDAPLAAGHYDVVASDGSGAITKTIEVLPNQRVSQSFDVSGSLSVSALESARGKPIFVHWKIYQLLDGVVGEQVAEGERSHRKFELPAGNYRIVAQHDKGKRSRDVHVVAGRNTNVEVYLGLGMVHVSAVEASNGKPVFVNWDVYRVNRAGKELEQVAKAEQSSRSFKLSSGRYKIVATEGNSRVEKIIRLKSGKSARAEFVMHGRLIVSAYQAEDGPLVSAQWLIYAVDGGDTPVAEAAVAIRAEREFSLKPGRYRIVAKHDAMARELDVEIRPGEAVEKQFFLNLGSINASAQRAGDKAPVAVKWFVYELEKDGTPIKQVATSIRAEREFILPAGKYKLLGKHDSARYERVVEVVQGKKSVHLFVLPKTANKVKK